MYLVYNVTEMVPYCRFDYLGFLSKGKKFDVLELLRDDIHITSGYYNMINKNLT